MFAHGISQIPSNFLKRLKLLLVLLGPSQLQAITAAAGIAFDAEKNLAAEHGIVVEWFS
jgi:hypothetical protein